MTFLTVSFNLRCLVSVYTFLRCKHPFDISFIPSLCHVCQTETCNYNSAEVLHWKSANEKRFHIKTWQQYGNAANKKKVFSWIEPSDGFFGRKMIRTNILEITEINSRTLFEPHLLMLTAYFFHSDICGWSRIYGMMTEIDLKLNWFLE